MSSTTNNSNTNETASEPSIFPDTPAGKNPTARAEYFVQLLDSFAQQGTAEAKRIRSALIRWVLDYQQAEDKEAAKKLLVAQLEGIELGVTELLLNSVRKIYDRMTKQSRKMGTASPAAKKVRQATEGLGAVRDGLEGLLQAVRYRSEEMRDEALTLLEKGRDALEKSR